MPILHVPHREQIQHSDCLAACAAMVLDYLGRPVSYQHLLTTMGIGPIVAPRRNIARLGQLGLKVTYGESTMSLIETRLHQGQPVIAFVDTAELSYWSVASNHAVVIVGIDSDMVLVNDPAFTTAPQRVARGEFELAWLNADNTCAVLEQ